MAKRMKETERDKPLLRLGTPRDETELNMEALDEILEDQEQIDKIKRSIYYELTNDFEFDPEEAREEKKKAEVKMKKYFFNQYYFL